jgi:hypothetical protein
MSRWQYARLVVEHPRLQYLQPDGTWGYQDLPVPNRRWRQICTGALITPRSRQALEPMIVADPNDTMAFRDHAVYFLDLVGEDGWEYVSQQTAGLSTSVALSFLLRREVESAPLAPRHAYADEFQPIRRD